MQLSLDGDYLAFHSCSRFFGGMALISISPSLQMRMWSLQLFGFAETSRGRTLRTDARASECQGIAATRCGQSPLPIGADQEIDICSRGDGDIGGHCRMAALRCEARGRV